MGLIENLECSVDPDIYAIGGKGEGDVGDTFAIVKERDAAYDNVKNQDRNI